MTKKMKCYDCDKELSGSYNYCSNCRDKYGNRVGWLTFVFGVFIGLLILFIIFMVSHAFQPLKLLEIDEDKLVSDYVEGYYPEFENCTMEYNQCAESTTTNCYAGANIYCSELDNRDAMKALKGNPDETIVFEEGLTINKIFKLRLRGIGLI